MYLYNVSCHCNTFRFAFRCSLCFHVLSLAFNAVAYRQEMLKNLPPENDSISINRENLVLLQATVLEILRYAR